MIDDRTRVIDRIHKQLDDVHIAIRAIEDFAPTADLDEGSGPGFRSDALRHLRGVSAGLAAALRIIRDETIPF